MLTNEDKRRLEVVKSILETYKRKSEENPKVANIISIRVIENLIGELRNVLQDSKSCRDCIHFRVCDKRPAILRAVDDISIVIIGSQNYLYTETEQLIFRHCEYAECIKRPQVKSYHTTFEDGEEDF